jgi:parallel beta helix pectate lyase-like protein
MRSWARIAALGIVGVVAIVAGPAPTRAADAGVIRVPQDAATLEAAIERSKPGDTILLDGGTYPGGIEVPEDRPGITIRGVDRNAVVFDGENLREDAIEILADDVTLENLTAHDFTLNAFYWEAVDGFAGRFLTVWNVGLYGIYAIESRDGVFEDSLVSGAADAAFYIGECNPCDTIVRRVAARYSAIGYSGTNAGGNLEVRDSLWELNGSGIMPNSYEEQEAPPPQHDSLISGNTVRGSGSVPVPANSPLAGYVGIGIAVNGGQDNRIEGNTIEGSARYGIALFPAFQPSGVTWLANGNRIVGNTVSGSGTADLAVAGGMQVPSCFAGNTFGTSKPAVIEQALPCDARTTGPDSDPEVEADLAIPIPDAIERLGERPPYTEMPIPEPQPTMPEQGGFAFAILEPAELAIAGLVIVAIVLGLIFLGRRRRMA